MIHWKKEKQPADSLLVAVTNLLLALEVNVTQQTIRHCIDTHYASPSLMSIVHCLGEWGVDTRTTRMAPNQVGTMDTPALVHMRANNGADTFAVLIKTGKQITYVDGLVGEVSVAASEFEKMVTGVVLVPYVTAHSGEQQFDHKRQEQRARSAARVLRLLLLATVPLLAVTFAVVENLHTLVVVTLLSKSLGIVLCELLVRIQNGQNTSLLQRLCGTDSQAGCHSVLAQPIAKPFNIFSLSELGLAYFIGCLLALAISLPGPSPTTTALAVLLLGAVSFPMIAYLAVVQHTLGQWCKLCTGVHVLIAMEFLVGLISLATAVVSFPDLQQWILVVVALVSTYGVWLIASTERLTTTTNEFETKFARIVSNPENFELFLKPTSIALDLPVRIARTAPNADVHIKLFSQVDCFHCRQVHLALEQQIHFQSERVSVEIVLLTGNDEFSDDMGKTIYGLAKNRSSLAAYEAYIDWIQEEDINQARLLSWQKNLALRESEIASDEELQHIQHAIHQAGIPFTPLVTIDDHEVQLEGVQAIQATARWLRKYLAQKHV